MTWIPGDISLSETLTENDHLYETHINQLRESNPPAATVGRTTNCQYYCDGTADDIQIQAAITALSSGGVLHLKQGTYSISAVIALANNIIIEGEGIGVTIIQQATGINGDVFAGSTKSNFQIRDLSIDGNKANNPTGDNGISLTDCTDFTIEKVSSYNNTLKGFVTGGACADGSFIRCEGYSNTQDGIGIASPTTASGTYCDRISIIDGYFHDNTQYGIGLLTPSTGYSRVKNPLVLGNRCVSNGTYGISVVAADGARIIGNLIESSGHMGIDLGSMTYQTEQNTINSLIEGNIIKNCTGVTRAGINLQNGDYNRIIGNKCFDDQTPKTQSWGFRYNNGTYNIIALNDFTGNLTASTTGTPTATNIYALNQE